MDLCSTSKWGQPLLLMKQPNDRKTIKEANPAKPPCLNHSGHVIGPSLQVPADHTMVGEFQTAGVETECMMRLRVSQACFSLLSCSEHVFYLSCVCWSVRRASIMHHSLFTLVVVCISVSVMKYRHTCVAV